MAAVATRSSTNAVHANPGMTAGKDISSDSIKPGESQKGNPKIEISTSESKPLTSNASHSNSHLSFEPNPFEQSFGNPASDTPGKVQSLPPVASLTSPAPLGPGGTPGWQNSLRSGPLSPAMLAGPTSNYFDESFRGSFPTPNESSLRTGLTPGGGGSMFPAPSPNSQAIFNSLQSGGATPGTLDFQRTALNAAARSKSENNQGMSGPAPQGINKQEYQPAQQMHGGNADQFANHHETDAVNSLYLLAQTGNRSANQFAVPNQPMNASVGQTQHRMVNPTQDSPTGRGRQSIGSIGTGMSDGGDYDLSDASSDDKSSKNRGKKSTGGKAQATNGRRKAEDTPSKGSNKRIRNSIDESDDGGPQLGGSSNKKMTDEEKRRNFLERNRVAALKCRQRKKQWLANLQNKVEIFTAENEALSQQCNSLRDEIVNLKTLLLAHKDCPVTHAQGLGGNALAQVIGDVAPHPHPYGMPNGRQIMGMQPGQHQPRP